MILVLLLAVLAAGCSDDSPPPRAPRLAELAPEPAPPYDDAAEPAEAVLALVPRAAEVVTVTDWDQVRVQLGQPELTSEDLVSDRLAFWQRVDAEVATLTQGLLRDHDSRLFLDHGFSQDDVDWEARWAGGGERGFALGLRSDLDLTGVREAIAAGVGPLAGAQLRAGDALVVSGAAEEDVWASEERWAPLVAGPASSTYLRRGCIPLHTALGPDAGVEEQDALLAGHPVTTLEELDGFAIGFRALESTVRMEPHRGDLFARLRIGEAWPVAGFPLTYVDGAADPASGRIGYTMADPRAAAGLALVEELPFAVCNEVVPMAEPTGG